MLGTPAGEHGEIVQRWTAVGKPPLREYAPYFMHMFSLDFFFHLAIAADLISRVRPEGKADNKVDIAYLYYLPFCMVFVSSDNLHKRVVPLFLRPDQSFVEGPDLKADLKRIDEYYTQLPKEQTDRGVYKFATSPPDGICRKVKELWDNHRTRGTQWAARWMAHSKRQRDQVHHSKNSWTDPGRPLGDSHARFVLLRQSCVLL
jgi:hypothetical protein